MDEARYQIIGLPGFILADFIFIASGINSGDTLTILGSVVWVLSCLVWMIPLLKPRKDRRPIWIRRFLLRHFVGMAEA